MKITTSRGRADPMAFNVVMGDLNAKVGKDNINYERVMRKGQERQL
jgi:hypothetical protein